MFYFLRKRKNAEKARMTGALVSQALATKWNPEAKKQFEIFSIQLLQRPVEFTACGLFFLDRGLVTSVMKFEKV